MTAAVMSDDQRRELLLSTIGDLWPDSDPIDVLFAAALWLLPAGRMVVVRDADPGDWVGEGDD